MIKGYSLKNKRTRILAIGLGLTVGLVVVLNLIMPFYEAQAQMDETLEAEARRLRQSIRIIENEEVYRARLAEMERSLNRFRSQLLDTQDGTIARVQLEEIVRGVADKNGLRISRSNPLQEQKIGDEYGKVTLQINVAGDMTALTNFLYELTSHPKFLLVDELHINGFRVRDQIRLQPRINISGFFRLS